MGMKHLFTKCTYSYSTDIKKYQLIAVLKKTEQKCVELHNKHKWLHIKICGLDIREGHDPFAYHTNIVLVNPYPANTEND